MSNALSIAAVTMTLKRIIAAAVDPAKVTSLPLDRAAQEISNNGVNLFLYQTTPNSSYRNMDVPAPGDGLKNTPPLLALNLHYMLTAYGDSEELESDHRLLGQAMRALHDNAILPPSMIEEMTVSADGRNSFDLHKQPERVRITQEPMSLDEMSRLWTAFQAQYRLSAVYQASVVLIESSRRSQTPLPVLSRGVEDQGVFVSASKPPILSRVEYRDSRERVLALPAAKSGEVITLVGEGLAGRGDVVLLAQLNGRRVEIDRYSISDRGHPNRIHLQLERQRSWRAGSVLIGLEYRNAQQKLRISKPIPLSLAPEIIVTGGRPSVLSFDDDNRQKLLVNLAFPVRDEENVLLILTPVESIEQELGPQPIKSENLNPRSSPTSPVFDVTDVSPGQYRMQVRVDDVDSLFFVRTGFTFQFDAEQEVEL